MKTIKISGWEPGFDKVAMNKLLRDEFGYSLNEAKSAVDKIVSNEPVALTVDHASLARITSELNRLRVKFEA
ncbi:hypothetical protein M2650_04030 [Luteimonas sp. SX5]|uniref:Uncharacterized protein n=1 Tax=Luteimonas galliterrae TaxID=2940486 RepID=A0ABT0MG34_9GAMM|nr:hypothetical protein [Luteimonas galliterrae]